MRRMIGLAVAGALVLASCGSDDGGDASATAAVDETTTTTEATTTTAAPGPTDESVIRSYASALAPQLLDVSERRDAILECVTIGPDPADCEFFLSISVMSAGFVAKTLVLKIDGLEGDFGAPPDEIADLVWRTRSLAESVATAADAYDECSGACNQELGAVNGPLGQLESAAASWSPYL